MNLRLIKDNKDQTLALIHTIVRSVMYHSLHRHQQEMIEAHFKALGEWPDFDCKCELSTDPAQQLTQINIQIRPLNKIIGPTQ